jgi:ribosomal protein S18 acetylase RimI-like enzyme
LPRTEPVGPRIEPAGLYDLPGAYEVCLRTGDAGEDAIDTYRDPDLLGHVYVGPYLARGRGTQLVVVDDQGVCGYLLSTDDTADFAAWAERRWWPPLRARYPRLGDDSPDARLIRLIHEPEHAGPDVLREYPAHLHIDLLARARGGGMGRALIDRLLRELRERRVRGVHFGVDTRNTRAVRFYEHLGFDALGDEPWGVRMGMRLD